MKRLLLFVVLISTGCQTCDSCRKPEWETDIEIRTKVVAKPEVTGQVEVVTSLKRKW